MKEILNLGNKGLDGGSVFAIDKLWENPDDIVVNYEFNSNINLPDISDYNFICIEIYNSSSGINELYERVQFISVKSLKDALMVASLYSNRWRRYAYQNNTLMQNNGSSPKDAIPKRIYGIKLPITDLT